MCLFGFVVLIETPDVTISGTELCFPSGDYNLKNRVMFHHHCNLITGKRDLLEASAEAHVHGQIGSLILWVLYTMAMSYRLSTLIIRKTNEVSLVAFFFHSRRRKTVSQHT